MHIGISLFSRRCETNISFIKLNKEIARRKLILEETHFPRGYRAIGVQGTYMRSLLKMAWVSNFFFSSINSIGGLPLPPPPSSLYLVSIRIFIARFHCIAQNADKSHYPETTAAALKRAAYLAALKFQSEPFSETQ